MMFTPEGMSCCRTDFCTTVLPLTMGMGLGLFSWAAVLGLGTACARAGAGFGRRPATCWAALGALAPAPGGPSMWMRTLRSQSSRAA